MAKIQKKPLSYEDLSARLHYLDECLNHEVDVLKKLDLTQAHMDTLDAMEELQKNTSKVVA